MASSLGLAQPTSLAKPTTPGVSFSGQNSPKVESSKRGATQRLRSILLSFGGDDDGSQRWLELHSEQDAAALRLGAATIGGAASNKETYSPPHHGFTEEERALMNSYESLDYDAVNSELAERELESRTHSDVWWDWISRWAIFGTVGIVTGSLAAAVALVVEALQEVKYSAANSHLAEGNAALGFAVFLAASVGYALVAALLVCFIEPVAAGSGIPQLKAYLNGTNYLRLLQLKTLVVKLLGVTFSVASGLLVGKEGPMVHSGAVLGANISHLTGLRRCFGHKRWLRRFRNDRDKRDFVSGGAAAGVAAAFGAPIGGVLFALEEAASHWSIQLTWMVFFCAAVATFVLNLWKIASEPESEFGGLISFGPPSDSAYKAWETPFFLVCGVCGGLIGALFNSLNHRISHFRRDRRPGHPAVKVMEVLLVAFVTCTLQYFLPSLLDECTPLPASAAHADTTDSNDFEGLYHYVPYRCPNGTFNTMATMTFAGSEGVIKGFFHHEAEYTLDALAVYFIFTFTISCVTYGISVPSGLFVPCILMGCAFGRLYGEIMRSHIFPDSGIVPGTYALMGAVGVLGGVSRMTISLAVILMETTQNVQFLLPIMLNLLVSKWVGDAFNISLYDILVELYCMPFVESSPPLGMENMKAVQVASGVARGAKLSSDSDNDALHSHVKTVRCRETLGDLFDLIESNTHGGFPVVEESGISRVMGFITRNRLVTVLNAAVAQNSTVGLKLVEADFTVTLNSKRVHAVAKPRSSIRTEILDLAPFIDRDTLTVGVGYPVAKVYILFRSLGLRHLCVVDELGRAAGMITRKELMCAFDRDLQ